MNLSMEPVGQVRGDSGPSLRWLARSVLGENGVLDAVPGPRLVSSCLRRPNLAVRHYILRHIRQPAAGSNFESRTRWLRWLPDGWLLCALPALGYDGLVYPAGKQIIGHVFFQRRGGQVHVFSAAVNDAIAGKGYSVIMMLDFVAMAAEMPGVQAVRVGTGRNNVSRRLLERIKRHETELGWRVQGDGWVLFDRS